MLVTQISGICAGCLRDIAGTDVTHVTTKNGAEDILCIQCVIAFAKAYLSTRVRVPKRDR
jgi:hypothetical protein